MNVKPHWMPLFRSRLPAIALAALFGVSGGALADETSAPLMTQLPGAPFLGPIDVTITLPDADGRPIRDSGRGSAQFIDEGDGQLRLVVSGHIEEEGDAGFVVDGPYDDGGWRTHGDGMTFGMAPDGTIDGGGEQDGQAFSFSGNATPERVDLEVELTMLKQRDGGPPVGTVFLFHYDLKRTAKHPSTESTDNDCARIVWQARNITTFSGAMQLIQVPVCMKE